MRLLIVEDNLDIQANIAEYLEGDHYTLDFAYTGDRVSSSHSITSMT